MWVVKLGGSLQYSRALEQWLDILIEHGSGRVVIVPGGGKFAKEVRAAQVHWRFEDSVAHQMAVLAMQQYGLMLTGLNHRLCRASTLDAIQAVIESNQIPVWLPNCSLLDQNGIPASWDITSDSLAAWLAKVINAQQLALIKSVKINLGQVSVDYMMKQGIVDQAFCDFIGDTNFTTRIYGADQLSQFLQALTDNYDAGTVVSL